MFDQFLKKYQQLQKAKNVELCYNQGSLILAVNLVQKFEIETTLPQAMILL